MKLSCNVAVSNRQICSFANTNKRKHVKSTLALCKKSSATFDYCILLFSGQNKNGTKYDITNISNVHTRFVNEGKATIQFANPQQDLYIQADSILLKNFLILLKQVMNKETSINEPGKLSSMSVTPIQKSSTKLIIENRSQYPSNGFPRNLEILHINNIKRCSLDRGILKLNRLRLLDLSNNLIEYLPQEFCDLPNLVDLNISNNRFNKSTVKQWNWMNGRLKKTLKVLNLSNNGLLYIPEQIVKLYALVNLHVDNNELKYLPSGIGTKNLQVFTASQNKIEILPGSVQKWHLDNLDLSHNNFIPSSQISQAAIFPKPLPVWSLKEYAARQVLHYRLSYTPSTLPLTLIDYLQKAHYCVCGKSCFSVYLEQTQTVFLTTLARSVNISTNGAMHVPMKCYFCSLKCFSSVCYNRRRTPVI